MRREKRWLRVAVLVLMGIILSELTYAQDFQRIKNRWKNTYIQNQNGPLADSKIQPGWWSAQWVLEKVQGTNFVRIKNRWTNTYIHNQNGKLEIGKITPGWWSAHWTLEKVQGTNFVRIKNRWKGTYLHNQNGKLDLGNIDKGWWSAQWVMESLNGQVVTNNNGGNGQERISIPGTNQSFTEAQLKQELQKGGLRFVKSSELKPNECTIVYPEAKSNKNSASAEMGLLTCATKVGDDVTLKSTAVYGGCDASARSGAGAECEAGVASGDLIVKIDNNRDARFNVKGPNAGACASVSPDKFCANAGADVAASSFEVTDSRGNGIGIGVSAGIGAGFSGGYENGIISAGINIKFLAGGSLSFSLNVKDAGSTIAKAGRTGYVLVKRQIVAAAPELKRRFNRLSNNLQSTANKVVKIYYQGGKEAIEFLDGTFQDIDRDVSKFFEDAGHSVSNWAIGATKGAKSPKLASGEGYLHVFNQAGYVTEVSASYYLNGKKYSNKERISAGFTKQFYFPRGAYSIKMKTKGIATIDKLNLDKSYSSLANQKKCFKVWGTIFDVEWEEQRCR